MQLRGTRLIAAAAIAALLLPAPAAARARHHYHTVVQRVVVHRVVYRTRTVWRTHTVYQPVTWDIAPAPVRSAVSWAGALPTWKENQ